MAQMKHQRGQQTVRKDISRSFGFGTFVYFPNQRKHSRLLRYRLIDLFVLAMLQAPSCTASRQTFEDASVAGTAPNTERDCGPSRTRNRVRGEIRIISDFEGATPIDVTQMSPSHFEVSVLSKRMCQAFAFRVSGAAGKTIRIDLKDHYLALEDCESLSPVYCYSAGAEESKAERENQNVAECNHFANCVGFPSISHQEWHFVENVWRERPDKLSFSLPVEEDNLYVAMRVPLFPKVNEELLKSGSSNPAAKIVQIGLSREGRPLLVAEIGADDQLGSAGEPCVLVYAMEHSDEYDAGWVAQGLVQHLAGGSPDAKQLRERVCFLVIPMLDPDACAHARHESPLMTSFMGRPRIPSEAIEYANWIKSWVDSGHRLDVVIDLHDVQSKEQFQVACPVIATQGERGELTRTINGMVFEDLAKAGYDIDPEPWTTGIMPDRLGGWIASHYGALFLAYEIDSQAPRHMTLSETEAVGVVLARSAARYFASDVGRRALAHVDRIRHARARRLAASGVSTTQPSNAIEFESAHLAPPGSLEDITVGERLMR